MTYGRTTQLLDRCDVAMACGSCHAVCVDSSQPRLRWPDSPLRLWGQVWASLVSQHRIPTAQGETVDTAGQGDCVRGRVAGVSLQTGGSAALPDQGHGFSRLLDTAMKYPTRVLIALDQLFATVFLGTLPDETISAAAHRRGWKKTERFINWIFQDDMHCAMSYIAELVGTQNATDYRR